MKTKILANQLFDTLDKFLPIGQFTGEVKENIKESISSILHDMDVVTREEFEAQKQVLYKTRIKIEQLEKKLNRHQPNE